MTEPMHERLVALVLAAARELEECADSGEHPAAAVSAVEAAYYAAERLAIYGHCSQERFERLYSVLLGCEDAARRYLFDAESAACKLRLELKRLGPLVKVAKAAREAELCGFGC